MVNQDRQRKRSALHVIKDFCSLCGDMLSDVLFPSTDAFGTTSHDWSYDMSTFPVGNSRYALLGDKQNTQPPIAPEPDAITIDEVVKKIAEPNVNTFVTKKRICLRCKYVKPIEEFYVGQTTQQWTDCYDCRIRHAVYVYDEYTVPKPSFTSNESTIFKRKAGFNEVVIADNLKNNSDLETGELVVTWGKIAIIGPYELTRQRDEKRFARRTKPIPWAYKATSSCSFEFCERRRFESLWYAGRDEDIPDLLLRGNSWGPFWEFVLKHRSNQSLVQDTRL